MNRNSYLTILAATLLFTASATAAPPVAAPPIKDQPISIYADQLSIDDTTGVSRYRGHVKLQQGDLKFAGDELELTLQDGSVTLMQAKGRPARFERSTPKPLKAEATHIDYDNNKGEVILSGNALLLQDGDQFSGALIHYNVNSRRVRAQGSTDTDKKDGRVHVLIHPKVDGDKEDTK